MSTSQPSRTEVRAARYAQEINFVHSRLGKRQIAWEEEKTLAMSLALPQKTRAIRSAVNTLKAKIDLHNLGSAAAKNTVYILSLFQFQVNAENSTWSV